jgi:GTP-binding protein
LIKLKLELKLLADVGLIGFPNAGKSTLISRLSAARPKIADYPFTTLEPNLGVVEAGEHTFVMADIPGLIEGAHEGHGLGIQFLRHVERTRLLVHLVDVSEFSGRDPAHDFDVILSELSEFSEAMPAKPMIVLASKIDSCQDPARIDAVRAKAREHGSRFLAISSVTGAGIEELRYAMSSALLDQQKGATISVGS